MVSNMKGVFVVFSIKDEKCFIGVDMRHHGEYARRLQSEYLPFPLSKQVSFSFLLSTISLTNTVFGNILVFII